VLGGVGATLSGWQILGVGRLVERRELRATWLSVAAQHVYCLLETQPKPSYGRIQAFYRCNFSLN
jgi:hypothetical protein